MTDTCGLGIFTETAIIEGVDLQEETIYIFLCFFHSGAACFQVSLQVRPGVLVKTANAGNARIIFSFQEYIIKHGHLASFPESTRCFRCDPVKALSAALVFCLFSRICCLCSQISCQVCITACQSNSTVACYCCSFIEHIFSNVIAHDVAFMFIQPVLGLFADLAVSVPHDVLITRCQMSRRKIDRPAVFLSGWICLQGKEFLNTVRKPVCCFHAA